MGVNRMIEMLASGGAVLFADQWSKRFVQRAAERHSWARRVLQIRCVPNQRDLYKGGGARAVFVVVWVAALLSAIILHQSGAWFQGHLGLIGVGLALGGAAGNLWDILRWHYVIDFIDLRFWPVFNLADAAIVGGLLLAFW
jgi:signal peptidase II